MKLRGIIFLSGLCLFLSFAAAAQMGSVDRNARVKPALVILGSYHMGTPGNNVVNPRVDDISSPERQKQVARLIEKLKKFRPTKIVLELDHPESDEKTQALYDRYLAGTYQLTKNETNQIGFRLAKEMGHKKIYCADWSDFWDDPSINYEKYAAQDPEFDKFLKGLYAGLKTEVDDKFAGLSRLSVVDQLIAVNRPAWLERSQKLYFDYLRIGRGKEYIGANYVAWWYRRNLTILTNIIRLTESPSDRILVIFGYGHAKLLNQFAKESGFYNVESPLKYLQGGK